MVSSSRLHLVCRTRFLSRLYVAILKMVYQSYTIERDTFTPSARKFDRRVSLSMIERRRRTITAIANNPQAVYTTTTCRFVIR